MPVLSVSLPHRPGLQSLALIVAAGLLLGPAVAQQQQRGVTVPPKTPIAGAGNGVYYALVIGINQYRAPLPTLQTAVNDAQAVTRILTDRYGFHVTLLVDRDATRTSILNAFDQYRRTLKDDDNLLIYYAGHGHFDSDAEKAYWQPFDADRDMSSNWISADDLTTKIRVLPARHVLVISDSCYSGALTRDAGGEVRPADPNVFLRKMLAGRSRTLMASGGNEPVADGGAAGHSVFANAVLRALDRMDAPAFTAGDLFYTAVQQQVAGKSEQVPHYSPVRNSGHDEGDFVFIRVGAALKLPAAGSARDSAASAPELPSASTDSRTVHGGDWEELKDSPPGLLSLVVFGKMLVGVDGSGRVYRSEDSGAHWTSQTIPPIDVRGSRAPVSPPVTRLASCGTYLLAGVYSNRTYDGPAVYISQDAVTWQPSSLFGNRVSALRCVNQTALASMWPKTEKIGQGVFRALSITGDVEGDVVYPALVLSHDGGKSWAMFRKRFDASSMIVSSQRMEVFGNDGYMPDYTSLEYCSYTTDWACLKVRSKYQGGFPSVLQRLADELYVGTRVGSVMVSASDGKTWKETQLPLPSETQPGSQPLAAATFPNEVSAITVTGQRVVAATRNKGVYLSDDHGGAWNLIGGRAIERAICLASDGAFLYVTSQDGVSRLRFGGSAH
ncbi:MAG TPA: caspase family protein [Bryobacteraceae bacterium]|nr:caspase family protein [Bryobacteraceae bacterium]